MVGSQSVKEQTSTVSKKSGKKRTNTGSRADLGSFGFSAFEQAQSAMQIFDMHMSASRDISIRLSISVSWTVSA